MSADKQLLATTRELLRVVASSTNDSDFCRALVHQVLAPQKAVAAFVCRLNYDGNLAYLGRYGYEAKAFRDNKVLSIWEPRVITDAIRGNHITFARNREHYHQLYPQNVMLGVPGDGFAGIPIRRDGQAVGGLGIAFDCDLGSLDLHPEFWDTLQLVAEAHFVPVWSAEARFTTRSETVTDPGHLSPRQQEILGLIVQGKTNLAIARKLVLSESSIKQETVRIFKALGVTNRREAAARAEVLGLIDQG